MAECLKLCDPPIPPITLIGVNPVAPAVDALVDTVKSSAYHTFEFDIFCADDSLPFDNWYSILHVGEGITDYEYVGSRVFAIYRTDVDNSIMIVNPIEGRVQFYNHFCVANTWSSYKLVVKPLSPSNRIAQLFINGEVVAEDNESNYGMSKLVGDGVDLQVWAGREWGIRGTASPYLIKNLMYTPGFQE